MVVSKLQNMLNKQCGWSNWLMKLQKTHKYHRLRTTADECAWRQELAAAPMWTFEHNMVTTSSGNGTARSFIILPEEITLTAILIKLIIKWSTIYTTHSVQSTMSSVTTTLKSSCKKTTTTLKIEAIVITSGWIYKWTVYKKENVATVASAA